MSDFGGSDHPQQRIPRLREYRAARGPTALDYRIHNDGTTFVRKGLSKSIPNVAGLFDADAFRTHGLGDLGEIGILELHAERDFAG
jgi:hypothetical protein